MTESNILGKDSKVLYILLQGSSSWKSKYSKDSDYIFIVDKLKDNKKCIFKKDIFNDIDIFYQTLDYTKELMQGDYFNKKDYKALCNLFLAINDKNFPEELKKISWLKAERKIKEKLKDYILADVKNNDKYLYTYYILFKMWEYKTSEFKDEYTEIVDSFKLNKNIGEMKEYIKKELEVIHND